MRLLGTILAGLGALAVAAACSSSEGGGVNVGDAGSSAVTADYCTKYCNAQASSGTLQGTKAACLGNCCKDVTGGCPAQPKDDLPTDDPASDAGPDGSTCARPCDSACCGEGQGCGTDANGKPACVKSCTTAADCATGCCAPATNAKGEPVGPYVCKPADGKNYDCCGGYLNRCSGTACCVTDTQNNKFCAVTCSANAMCGAGHCVGFGFSYIDNIGMSCTGPLACGP